MKFSRLYVLLIAFYSNGAVSTPPHFLNSKKKEKTQNSKEIKIKPAPLPTYDMGSSWLGVRFVDGVSTYTLKENPKVIGTFHLHRKDKNLDLKKIKTKKFFKDFVRRKKEQLGVMNIWEWTVDQHQIRKKEDSMELDVLGSYKRDGSIKVFFKEKQVFFVDQVYQILVISPEKKVLQSKSIQIFFKKALREVSKKQRISKDNKVNKES